MKIVPIGDEFIAEIHGIDARQACNESARAELIRAIDRYAVLVFRGRVLSSDELIAFSKQFGMLDTTLSEELKLKAASGRKLGEELFDVSTVDEFGQVAARNSARTQSNVGSRVWHTDGAYKHRPYRYSMLCAEVLPSWGGITEYADLRAAYDALDDASRQIVIGRNAEHDFYYWLTDILGFPAPSAEDRAKHPAIVWPLVRTHPGSRRKLLWIETAVSRISGMSVPEGRALARDLLEQATHHSRTYRHVWKVGDLVVWDNRAVLHRGRLFDYSERRELQRATTRGDDESLGVSSDALLA